MLRKLNTWKEIAQYLGKGVRTVQRYETEFGIPVRRLKKNGNGSVVAIAEELDSWLQTHATQSRPASAVASEIEMLRKQLASLEAENERLRHELDALQTARCTKSGNAFGTSGVYDLPKHLDRVLSDSVALRRQTAEALDRARNLQLLCRQEVASPPWRTQTMS